MPGITTIKASRTIIRMTSPRRRADAHAHADLADPRRHRIRDQAEQPDRCEHHCQGRGNAGGARDQSLLEHRVIDPGVHREHRAHQVLARGIDRFDVGPLRRRHIAGDAHVRHRCLAAAQVLHHRPVQAGDAALANAADIGVGDDADDLDVAASSGPRRSACGGRPRHRRPTISSPASRSRWRPWARCRCPPT